MMLKRAAIKATLVLAFALPAYAHVPTISDGSASSPDQALAIEDLDLSQVIYHEVAAGSEQLWLSLDVSEPRSVFVQLGIPVLERLESFRPAIAILGPGLPDIELPFDVPSGLGGLLFSKEDVTDPRRFDEPFSGTSSWILSEERVDLPVAGDYLIVAFVPSGDLGKLWVAIGDEERFELDDLLELPAELQAVRAFHEVDDSLGSGLICPIIGFLSLAAPLLLIARRPR